MRFDAMKRSRFSNKYAYCGMIFIAVFCLHCAKNTQKILFINSYNQGYAPSDSVETGIREILSSRKNIVLSKHHMVIQKQHDMRFIKQEIQETLKAVRKYNPNVVIAYGDDAVKYVIAPYFRKKHIPVVFCGVKWACDQYGLPTETITGMLEILPIKEMISQLHPYYPEMHRLSVISENTVSERKNIKYLNAILLQMGITVRFELVDDFEEWKNAFIKSNRDADVLFLSTGSAIPSWNPHRALEFVYRNVRKPVMTSDPSMMPVAVFGITNVDRKQGIWAASAAIKILSGNSITDIHVATNRETKQYLNLRLADRIRFRPNSDFIRRVEKIE